ncbi:MAG: Tex family protein [Eubacteriales bacterium]|nr:Tex family protein [Eubacteriales bacterium]MDD4682167.1 Tex family protein [Eubacteriales bacterium]
MEIKKVLQEEFAIRADQVEQTLALIDDGNTIPFIARYRKEMTGNLDDQTLRKLSERYEQLKALEQRRADIRRLLEEQDVLSTELERQLINAASMTELEDIYRPFRPKRKTRASVAAARGLTELADYIIAQQGSFDDLKRLALLILDRPEAADIDSVEQAIAGAQDILAERLADDAWVRRRLRMEFMRNGQIESSAVKNAGESVYEPYYDYSEPVSRIASHRVLAINRGEKEKYLNVKVTLPADAAVAILSGKTIQANCPWAELLLSMIQDAWKRLLQPSLENEIRQYLSEQAQEKSIDVFSSNLRSLLMQAPVHGYRILGLDPAFRTGCKLAVVNETGLVLDTDVIYPTPPHNRTEEAARILSDLISKYGIQLIAIGNGTASRESEQFVRDLVHEKKLPIRWMVVSEAGASVYSASELGAAEFPNFDVSLRSAVSIARRLQDPLAELVKIEPKAIGVGQYQHDMNQKRLDEALGGVVEACVNEVGVDLNTASPSLLSYVAGLTPVVARNIVARREKDGPFVSRQELLKIPRLGPKAFEQCAGFLRIPEAQEPLDNTSVHPESYAKVYQLSAILGLKPSVEMARKARQKDLISLAEQLNVGELTLEDILEALTRPGRDPRDDLPQPVLRSDLLDIKDLRPDMVLQGVVRNVADFGAFVDLGMHNDGLVHISELADHFVKNPQTIVHVGQAVQVRVLSVDIVKKRISLSMKGLKQGGSVS